MSTDNFKAAFIAVYGQEAWDKNQAEVEEQIKAEDEYDALTDFDCALGEGRR